MGVGSIGEYLKPYDECDTFLSTDAGLSWKMIRDDAHKYEFGDSGSIIVVVNDEEGVDEVRYSSDLGKSWSVGLFKKLMAVFSLIGNPIGRNSISVSRCARVFLQQFQTRRPKNSCSSANCHANTKRVTDASQWSFWTLLQCVADSARMTISKNGMHERVIANALWVTRYVYPSIDKLGSSPTYTI